MNPLIKKEIRLLLPGFLAILALEVIAPWFLNDHDFDFGFTPVVFFFGMIIIAIDSFGREFSPGTFTLLMSQPVERRQIWQTKIIVLFLAAVLTFAAYFVACELRLHQAITNINSIWHANPKTISSDFRDSMIASVAVMFVALTGGLWTSLLLRQTAAAFWITLLAPVGLAFSFTLAWTTFGISKFFHPSSAFWGQLPLFGLAAIYSIAGFLLAHRLFHRAQDAAWTGGVINFSKWRYFDAGAESSVSVRCRKPLSALLKKEFQLHSIGLIGAGALVVVHLAVRALYANSNRNSTAGLAAASVWILWLVMPLMIGCMAVAEERKLGVTEAQLCLPASRRFQFATKFIPVMIFGVLLGGIMPLLLETVASHFGVTSEFFKPEDHAGNQFGIPGITLFEISIVALAAGFALAGFFASTLAKNFLQALSITIVIIIGCCLFATFLFAGPSNGNGQLEPLGMKIWGTFLPLVIGILTAILFIPWLAYRNFSRPVEGRRLWQRNILAFIGAVLFIFASSSAIYNRAWEIFEPAEPAHGPAIFSSANAPKLQSHLGGNLQVQFPDGRIWFNSLGYSFFGKQTGELSWFWWTIVHPLPVSAGPQQFMAGSNWVSATAEHIVFWNQTSGSSQVNGYLDTVGVQADGSLWISSEAKPVIWTGAEMIRFGDGTNWKQVIRNQFGLLLLKRDGTLWQWGTNQVDWRQWQTHWPTARASKLQQLGTNSDWQKIFSLWNNGLARKNDGSVWQIDYDWKIERETNLDQIVLDTFSASGRNSISYIGKDGTLWASYNLYNESNDNREGTRRYLQVGRETNWVATVMTPTWMVALKSDGTLWQWHFHTSYDLRFPEENIKVPPTRLGIHNDWLGLTGTWDGAVALAADGGLWFWPNGDYYAGAMLKAPKQPQCLGNVFGKGN